MENESIIYKKIHGIIPEYLYHYTSSNGLLGIIKEKKLRVTKINYLNDSSELNLAIKYFREEITSQIINRNNIRSIDELKEMLNRLDNVTSFGINLAVASFTTQPDQLSQWRGYCRIGDGYCMGFYGEKLQEEIANNGYLVQCSYETSEHESMVKEVINSCVLGSLHLPPKLRTSISNMDFETAVLFIAPMIKDRHFSQEEEWRLVTFGAKSEAQLRSGNFTLIPYWELELPKLDESLYKIIIGPTPLKELSKDAVRILVRSNHLLRFYGRTESNESITNSNIPYGSV